MSTIFDSTANATNKRRLNLEEFWRRLDIAPRETASQQVLRHIKQVGHYTAMRPFACFFTIITTALALSVFACVLLLTFSSKNMITQQGATIPATVFILDSASELAIRTLETKIKGSQGVQAVDFVNKQQALDKFKSALDIASSSEDIFNATSENNPLPRSFVVSMQSKEADSVIAKIKNELDNEKIIELVQFSSFDVTFSRLLSDAFDNSIVFVVPIGIILVGFLIATTIRLSVAASIDEIHTMWILGAKRRFVYTPFLLHALLQGLLAAVLALLFTDYLKNTIRVLWNQSFGSIGLTINDSISMGSVIWIVLIAAIGASFFAALLALHTSTKEH